MERLRRIAVVACAILVAVACALPITPVSAAESASSSLSIVPKKNYVIEQGKSVDDTLTIRNIDTLSSLTLSLRVIDFTYTDEGGTPKLMLDEDAPQTTWSLKPYLTVPKTVTIPPNSTKTLDMNVKIPAGHGAGSYYSAIIYSSGTSDGGNVGLSASGVTLVFVSIPGQVNEDLQLKKFGPYDRNAKGTGVGGYTYFNLNEPLSMAYTLQNNGNVTESPVGSITIKDLFGHERIINNVNPSSSLALIGQTRTFVTCIKTKSEKVDFSGTRTEASECTSPGFWPGYYRASLSLYYGQNGNNTQEINKTISFWYLPMWFILTVIAILLVLGVIIWRTVRKIRNKANRTRMPKKAKQSSRRSK